MAQGVAVGFWQRSSGAAQGVGSNNIATMEYQLPEVQPTRIRSAIFQFSGRAIQCRRRTGRGRRLRVSGRRKERRHRFDRRHARRDAVGRLRDNPAFNKPIDVTHLVRQLSVPSGVRHVGFNVRKGNNRRGPASSPCIQASSTSSLPIKTSPWHRARSYSAVHQVDLPGGSQVDVNRVIGGLVGAAGTLLGGGGSKPARDQAGNEAAAVLTIRR